jgi:hypothetical protein
MKHIKKAAHLALSIAFAVIGAAMLAWGGERQYRGTWG